MNIYASLSMCRKLPTKCFLGTNLNAAVSILNKCRKFFYKMQENFLQVNTSAGKFPTGEY